MGKTVLLLLAAAMLGACDEGRIYADGSFSDSREGVEVTLAADMEGCADYGSDGRYSVVMAAFAEGDRFALVSKPLRDGADTVTLSGLPENAATVEVCLISRLRERVFTFASKDVTARDAVGIVFEPGHIDAGRFHTLESMVFATTCAQCHGATGTSAAALDLTEGHSYSMLVDVESGVVPGKLRVAPGDAAASTLWEAVATDASSDWRFNHANLLVAKDIDFIENWINSGAHD